MTGFDGDENACNRAEDAETLVKPSANQYVQTYLKAL